jgi:hypothetical protein
MLEDTGNLLSSLWTLAIARIFDCRNAKHSVAQQIPLYNLHPRIFLVLLTSIAPMLLMSCFHSWLPLEIVYVKPTGLSDHVQWIYDRWSTIKPWRDTLNFPT